MISGWFDHTEPPRTPKRDGHARTNVRTYTMARIHPGLGCLALMRSALDVPSMCVLIDLLALGLSLKMCHALRHGL